MKNKFLQSQKLFHADAKSLENDSRSEAKQAIIPAKRAAISFLTRKFVVFIRVFFTFIFFPEDKLAEKDEKLRFAEDKLPPHGDKLFSPDEKVSPHEDKLPRKDEKQTGAEENEMSAEDYLPTIEQNRLA